MSNLAFGEGYRTTLFTTPALGPSMETPLLRGDLTIEGDAALVVEGILDGKGQRHFKRGGNAACARSHGYTTLAFKPMRNMVLFRSLGAPNGKPPPDSQGTTTW